MSERVFIAYLRAPRRIPDEKRSDPYYELGSYGITTCHCRDLMHPKHAEVLKGSRIAFVQPGYGHTRLVFLSPLIHTTKTYDVINPKPNKCVSCTEALWEPITRPLKFEKAPLICNNEGETDFPLLMKYVDNVNQPSPVSKLMSKFRGRARVLEDNLGNEIVEVFESHIGKNPLDIFAEHYWETMPNPPPKIEKEREKVYNNYKSRLRLTGTFNHK